MNTTTSTALRTLVAGAILSALALSFATVSNAADDTVPPQVIVKFGDLNISNPQGAATLYARIRSAAKSVCSQFDGRRLEEMAKRDACINKAILGAVTKVNNSALSAVYSAKTAKEAPTHLASN
jgi:UrcA family protein